MMNSFLRLAVFLCVFVASTNGRLGAQESEGYRWYKGNLHTHSFWSDGNDFPEMIVKWYADRGYHFMALTDHNILQRGEKWLTREVVERRGGTDVIPKYNDAFGENWVETKGADEGKESFRLKRLEEYRTKFEEPEKFLILTGEEISDQFQGKPIHMNATNLDELLPPAGGDSVRDVMNNNLRAAAEQAKKEDRQIIVHLNHPNFGWAVTAEDLAFVTLERFFEVFNGHPAVNHRGDVRRAGVERIWDIANTIRLAKMKEPPLFGLGTDDSHHYHGKGTSQPGRGWIMVRSQSLDSKSLMDAMYRGDFYASSGVSFREILFDRESNVMSLQIEPVDGQTFKTQFIGTRMGYDQETKPVLDGDGNPMKGRRIYSEEVGEVLAEVDGLTPQYEFKGDELYVRAVVTSSESHNNPVFTDQKKQAWTQPVGWRDRLNLNDR